MEKKRDAFCHSEPQEHLSIFLMACDLEAEGVFGNVLIIMYFPHFIGFNCGIHFLSSKGFPLGLFPKIME